jgi:hypothetical protein
MAQGDRSDVMYLWCALEKPACVAFSTSNEISMNILLQFIYRDFLPNPILSIFNWDFQIVIIIFEVIIKVETEVNDGKFL